MYAPEEASTPLRRETLPAGVRPLQELIPWLEFLRPGLILQKDGSLLAGFEARGIDMDAATPEASKYATEQLEHAYRIFDGRVTLWWVVDRTRYPRYPSAAQWHNAASQTVDEMHRAPFEAGEYFVNRNYLFVLFSTETGVDNFFERFNHYTHRERRGVPAALIEAARDAVSDKRMFNVETAQLDAMADFAEETLGSFETACPDVSFDRLNLDELSGALYRFINPGTIDSPAKPRGDHPLDAWLPAATLRVGHELLEFQGMPERRYQAVFGIKDWPTSSYPHLFSALASMNAEVMISQCFKFLGDGGRRVLEQTRRYYVSTQVGLLKLALAKMTNTAPRAEPGQQELIDEIDEALSRMNQHGLRFGYHTINVVVRGRTRDEVERYVSDIARELNNRRFVPVRERLNLLSAWQASLPGCWDAITRYQTNSVENLADASPIYSVWTGDTRNDHLSQVMGREMPPMTTMPTRYGTPFAFNAQLGQNGHLLCIGPTRTGKTTLFNFLLSQAQKYSPRTIVFDRDKSCRITTILHGGSHIDMGAGGKVRINPFSVLVNATQDDVIWLRNWLIRLIGQDGYAPDAEDRREIDETVEMLKRSRPDAARMSEFYTLLPSMRLKARYFEWCEGQPMGHVFDHVADEFAISDWTCFEMKDFLKYANIAGPFIDYAFHQVYRRLDGRPTIIYLEEAWSLLGNPLFLAMLNDWLRTFAKKNARIWMATQSVVEIKGSDMFSALIESCPNKLFLANPGLRDSEVMRDVYASTFALPDALIQLIGRLTPRLEYLLTSPDFHRVFSAHFSPEILAFLRSEAHVQKMFDKHMRSDDSDWMGNYINEVARMR